MLDVHLWLISTTNEIIEPKEGLLISSALFVSDFKKWIACAWDVPESEVKKPVLCTGGRVWMGVVHKLNKMIILRKYKLESEEYWMVTYVGPIAELPNEVKRRRISYDNISTDTNRTALPCASSSSAKNVGHISFAVDSIVSTKTSSLEPPEEKAISALLNMHVDPLPAFPTSMRSVILESLDGTAQSVIVESLLGVVPEVGMLLSANLQGSDFRMWVAHCYDVKVSEVRRNPVCSNGRAWMASISRLNKMIIIRKYRVPLEHWIVTYYDCVCGSPVEIRRRFMKIKSCESSLCRASAITPGMIRNVKV